MEMLKQEISLDPENWDTLRQLGHQMVDDMLVYLETVRERPTWQPIPPEIKQRFQQPVPLDSQDLAAVYEEFQENILPYPLGNIHPRFWGWVIGTGTPVGMLAEMLAAGMNPNVGGAEHAAVDVELQVLNWFKDIFGLPKDSSGLLVSGGSMANLVGLTVARNATAEFDIRTEGVQAAPRKMVLYSSRETHSSNQKAAELLGLGSEALRKIPVNEKFEIDIAALEAAVAADKAAGLYPFCIIGNAGTVNTGAVDDLDTLADICQREGMWFHIDGAFGALAVLSDDYRPLLKGIERADSLAFDLHKWMYMPIEVGCALVRYDDKHRRAFSLTPDYLVHAERGTSAAHTWLSDYGIQLSRGFRALKVWMSLKTHGLNAYKHAIHQNIEQARYLGALVDAAPELENLAPVAMNLVCFRYVVPGMSEADLNRLNEQIVWDLQEKGIAVPTSTILNGRFAIRVAITNHRSRREDFDLLVQKVIELGRERTT